MAVKNGVEIESDFTESGSHEYAQYWSIFEFRPSKKREWLMAKDLKYIEKYKSK